MGGGRLGVKNCGRWEIGGKKMWEVGDGHPCVTPLFKIRIWANANSYTHCAVWPGCDQLVIGWVHNNQITVLIK